MRVGNVGARILFLMFVAILLAVAKKGPGGVRKWFKAKFANSP